MRDIAELIATLIDEIAPPVTVEEARRRARRRVARTALAAVSAIALVAVALAVLVAIRSPGPRPRVDVSAVSTTTVSPSRPSLGSIIGVVEIRAIDVRVKVREGTTVETLRLGPGHDPRTPVPGEPGNVVIVGHRTTYTAPFIRLAELRPGDDITITTTAGAFDYVVTANRVVQPSALDMTPHDRGKSLTLVTYEPKYSATLRRVITARQTQS
jgi:LPXTG-site transpeptidase (sortase) family protein